MTSHNDDDDFDLDALKSAFKQVTPAPVPARKLENLALAKENFAALQGSRDQQRLTSERPKRGAWQGVKEMLNAISTKGGLTVTTALVACGVLFLTPQGQQLLRPGAMGEADIPAQTEEAPVPDAPVIHAEPVLTEAEAQALWNDLGQTGPVPEAPNLDAQASPTGDTAPGQEAAGLQTRTEAVPVEDAIAANEMTRQAAPDAALDLGAVEGHVQPVPAPAATQGYAAAEAADMAGEGFGAEMVEAPVIIVEPMPETDTEAFANAADNPLKITVQEPVSTFSIDVDTASYAVVRQSLAAGYLPVTDAVRVEEMVNYFPYDYPAPAAGEAPFQPTVTVFETPWNPDTELVHIGIQGMMPAIEDRPPLNLVFLIDTSGSMEDANKLPLLKQSFRLMLDNLRPEDRVAIVEYAGSAGLVLDATPASERQTILNAIQNLGAGGSTNGQGGLEQAYAVAEAMTKDGEVSRILLATDGDFNVGETGTQGLTDYIAAKRDTGVYLSVLGFGRGNLDDATMQALAQNGNGTAAYIDTLNEAQKVLVDQLTGALFPIAGDVKVQVEFNPAIVAEYRLIGYETRALNREDFNNDRVDAGELGAGHTVTAIYEITPVGSPAVRTEPLRYGTEAEAAPVSTETSDEIGFLRLRWKEPGSTVSQLMETPITGATIAGTGAQFAAAIAGFGQLLRDSDYLGDWGWDDAIALATANRGEDAFGYRTEAVQLMRLAQSLSE
jgi:Ca-activated chloride channel homolog